MALTLNPMCMMASEQNKKTKRACGTHCEIPSCYLASFLLSNRHPKSLKPGMSLAKGPHFSTSFAMCMVWHPWVFFKELTQLKGGSFHHSTFFILPG